MSPLRDVRVLHSTEMPSGNPGESLRQGQGYLRGAAAREGVELGTLDTSLHLQRAVTLPSKKGLKKYHKMATASILVDAQQLLNYPLYFPVF